MPGDVTLVPGDVTLVDLSGQNNDQPAEVTLNGGEK